MKAIVLRKAKVIDSIDIDKPGVGAGEVLIKVKVCGICGSDLHAYKNLHPDIKLPIIPGHEFSGNIVEIGGDVKRFGVGDRVCVEPVIPCGECYFCKRGEYNRCTELRIIGCQSNGAFAEYFPVDERWVHVLPENISYEEGAMVEPLAVAMHAVRSAGVKDGDLVTVFGAGTIGLLTLQAAKTAGASKVIVTDLIDWRLDLAKKLGADVTINPSREDAVEEILNATQHLGPDVSFEAVGHEAVLEQALKVTRKGGTVVVVGVYEEPEAQLHVMNLVNKELTVKGSLIYCEDYEKSIELIKSGEVKVKPLITHVLPLEKAKKGFELMTEKTEPALKVLLKP